MRKLTAKQLECLRGKAVKSLESASSSRIDFGTALEDLVVACDRALGWDEMTEEDEDEKHALIETSHQCCTAAWRSRHGRQPDRHGINR